MITSPESTGVNRPLGLFEAFGIELEYMIVDATSLDVRPMCDALFEAASGQAASDVEPDGPDGIVSWSNELALHVVELKTQRPAPTLDRLAEQFQSHVRRINVILDEMGCMLLPTGMHPWMDPHSETRLWPHENNEIYQTYDRIFGCRGHGWGNLQSTHINLPFANDEEFGRLHAALRLLTPILPALTASTPVADGKRTPYADYRMEVYRTNSMRVPMMAGLVAPEPIWTRDAYERDILGVLYNQLAPLDPEGVLHHEFANARGAMARFDRGAIEIRVLDVQECPQADIAIAALIVETARALVDERWTSSAEQMSIDTESLHAVLLDVIRDAERARISHAPLLASFGLTGDMTAGEIWASMLDRVLSDHQLWTPVLRRIMSAGSLSTRIGHSLSDAPTREELRSMYWELAACLRQGTLFHVN